jgi:hypothetical protein
VGWALGVLVWLLAIGGGLFGAVGSLFLLARIIAPAIVKRYHGVSDWRQVR